MTEVCISSMWHGITAFDIYFEVSGEKVSSLRSFFCGSLPMSYLMDQRRLLFWKRTITSDNIVLRTLGRFIRGRAKAVGSVYGVDALAVSRAGVGGAVRCSFAGLVRGVLGL